MIHSLVFLRFHQSHFLHLNYFILLNILPFIIINDSLLLDESIIHSTCLDLINFGSLNDLINSSLVDGILDQLYFITHINVSYACVQLPVSKQYFRYGDIKGNRGIRMTSFSFTNKEVNC